MDKNDDKPQLSFELETKSTPNENIQSKPARSGPELEWNCHPAKKNIRVTILVSIFILVLIAVVYYATDYSIMFAALAFLILFGSLASFYFPTAYRLTEDEIIIKTRMQTQTKKWSQYRSFYPDKNGVLLSPFVRPSRLENFRGLYIKFWFNRDEVLAFVKERLSGDDEKIERES